MYGLLIEAAVDFAKKRFGNAIWEKARKKAKIDQQMFSTHQQYSETMLSKIIKALSEVSGNSFHFMNCTNHSKKNFIY
jgi:guanylate cyclase